MDTYSMCADLCHQGYAEAPPPGTIQVHAPLPVPQSSASGSTPLAPPGIVPSPSPDPSGYYAMCPPHADRLNAHPVAAVEPRPSLSYPPHSLAYSAYGHLPSYQERFPYISGHLGPPQAHMSQLPPPWSDVTRFRKRRHLYPHHNVWPKNAVHADSGAFITPFSSSRIMNKAHAYHPFRQHRVNEGPVNPIVKKRKMEEKGDRRPATIDDVRREGDKSACRNLHHGKRKKGRKRRIEGSTLDTNADAKGTESGEKGQDRKCEGPLLTVEQVSEATWLKLQEDARKRVLEFLHPAYDNKVSLKTAKESTEGVTQGAEGGNLIASIQGIQEAIKDEVGRDAVGGAGADVVEKVEAAFVADMVTTRADEIEANLLADNNHDETGEAHVAILPVMQEKSAELCQHPPLMDATLADGAQSLHSDVLLSDFSRRNQYDKLEDFKAAREDILHVVPDLLPDPESAGIGEPVLSDQIIDEVTERKPPNESAGNEHIAERKSQVFSTEDELKDREERSFKFFTKLLEENLALRKLYVENCNDGTFQCLMCYTKTKKFTSLVSLVSHASNVLKTKRLPEHRGYGRAVCSLFGWDPCKIPSVPIKITVTKSIIHMPTPVNETAAVVGNGAIIMQGGDLIEHAPSNAVESVLAADDSGNPPLSHAGSCTCVNDIEQGKLGSQPVSNAVEVAVDAYVDQVPLTLNEACKAPHSDVDGFVDNMSKEAGMDGEDEGGTEKGIEDSVSPNVVNTADV